MLSDVGHEKTCGKPEPYQHVEHWAEQSCERCEQVGNGSGPEPERRQDRHLVPRPCLTRALSHDHGRSAPLFISDRSYLQVGAIRACSCIAFSTPSMRSVTGQLPPGRASTFGRTAKLVTVLRRIADTVSPRIQPGAVKSWDDMPCNQTRMTRKLVPSHQARHVRRIRVYNVSSAL